MTPEIMRAHRHALEEWARMYEADGGEGCASVAFFLGKASRQIGRLQNDPNVPDEPLPAEPITEHPRADDTTD